MVAPVLKPKAIGRIEAAIAVTEPLSRAELVAVIAGRAGDYRATGLTLATLGAFAISFVIWALEIWVTSGEIVAIQLGAFALLFALLELTSLGDRLTPVRLKSQAAQRLARAVFVNEGLASTPERSAILFFVSLAEHHVEILADRGINGRVGQGDWQRIVDTFAARVRCGKTETALVEAITDLGKLLATHYPPDAAHPNTLPNRLILLP